MILYNEIEEYPAEWLENLIEAGHLPAGRVERTDFRDMYPEDLPETFHAFAGIGGWALALRLAGWPDDVPVWTGSCPCQPFSTAGKRKGFSDDRHLWPYWREAISERRPAIVFGEQVASPDGRRWLSAVRDEMEALGYAVGGADLCAAGVGAPHIRQRLWFVAVVHGERLEGVGLQRERGPFPSVPEVGGGGSTRGRVGDAGSEGSGGDTGAVFGAQAQSGAERGTARDLDHESRDAGKSMGAVGDADGKRFSRRSEQQGHEAGEPPVERASGQSFWSDAEWLACRDGKSRPVEPGSFPLAHGVPNRVGRLRAYGNAIVPQAAAIFIRASVEAISGVT